MEKVLKTSPGIYQLTLTENEIYTLSDILTDFSEFGEAYLKEHQVNMHAAFSHYLADQKPGLYPLPDMAGTLEYFNGVLLSIAQYKAIAADLSLALTTKL